MQKAHKLELAYLSATKEIMETGIDRKGRNATTRSKFAIPVRGSLMDGFPAMTSKKLAFKAVKSELLWFLEGSGDDNRLKELNGTSKTIWTANAEADYWTPKAKFPGDLGRIYGVQWRTWQRPDGSVVDQIAQVVEKIRKDPNDRRLVVTAWNPGEIEQMALPPCHMMFQFYVAEDKLSLHMVQRSCDMFLGVPFNIASYALLLAMIAHVTGKVADELVITLNDAHIYHEHFAAVEEQLSREPLSPATLWLNPAVTELEQFTMDDIRLDNYQSHDTISAPMIV